MIFFFILEHQKLILGILFIEGNYLSVDYFVFLLREETRELIQYLVLERVFSELVLGPIELLILNSEYLQDLIVDGAEQLAYP